MTKHFDASVEIRAAAATDVESLSVLHVAAWRVYRGIVPDAYLDALEPRAKVATWTRVLADPRARVTVAESAAGLVGFCSLLPARDADARADTLELTSLYVDPKVWRSGIGRRLVADTFDFARARGFREMTLWVIDRNTRARSFYEAIGFAPDGATKVEQRPGFVLDEVRYRQRLSES